MPNIHTILSEVATLEENKLYLLRGLIGIPYQCNKFKDTHGQWSYGIALQVVQVI
jgi:hypothetical protein